MNSDSIEKRCNLPFAIEYAKSNRSTCKQCQKTIGFGSVRISAREPSAYFDGIQDNWFHFSCFWLKIKPGKDDINESSIRGVDWLKWEDQEMLRNRIKIFKEGKDLTIRMAPVFLPRDELNFQSMKIEPSATNRGKCVLCNVNFKVREVKCIYKSKNNHPKCLFNKFSVIVGTLDQVTGWDTTDPIERQAVTDAYNAKMEALLKEKRAKDRQTKEETKVEVIVELTNEPTTSRPGSTELPINIPSQKRAADSDCIVLIDDEEEQCELAKKRKLVQDERQKKRKRDKLKKQADKMWELRQTFEKLPDHENKELLIANKQDVPSGHEHIIERLVDCALFGAPAPCPGCSNGTLYYSSSYKTYVCTGYATEYTKCMNADKNPIRTPFVIPKTLSKNSLVLLNTLEFNSMVDRQYPEEEEIIKSEKSSSSFKYLGARRLNMNKEIADEACDPNLQINVSHLSSTSNSRQIIKKGTVVDSGFQMAEYYHVHKGQDKGVYSATLTFTDLACNKNSYYKMQLLKHDSRDVFSFFRSWGRVGTNVGGSDTRNCNESEGITLFEKTFKEKTGNEWKYRKFFKKFPGLFLYVETDYSEFEHMEEQEVLPGSRTKLPKPVKEIIMSIFDVENMKLAMKSFEMDVNKMPLGKLSKNQIMSAYSVLTELQNLLNNVSENEIKILDLSNKFYTIIPHNFGMQAPEPINAAQKIKEKSKMLDMLLDIQFAYDQIRSDSVGKLTNVDPVDCNYEKLKCKMEPLDSSSYDYEMIMQYMRNTHGSSHELIYDIIDVLKVERSGEREKFLAQIGNRKLLWHGSGKMNFAGILGQGLRIAPAEAPVSGYMFGKGVYFADMFTKSSFYCRANLNEEAYVLLCDVALGQSMDMLNARNVTSKDLGNTYHSVKGIGRECPEPMGTIYHSEGYHVPKGKAHLQLTGDKGKDYSLLYNEYIVYNTDQILLKYLVRIRVKRAQHRY